MRAPASRAWRGPTGSRSRRCTAGGSGTTTLAYDYESRITQITYPDQNTNSFAYNGLDTRVSKVDSTGTRSYLRDGAYVTDPVLSDGAATYTPGVSERRSGTTKFYHPDRLGTTERLTDTIESTTDTRQYDAFGLLTSSSGNTPTPFGFAGAWGYQEDPDSGLKLLGHRYYDPSTGRFLTRDPIKDGRNWYGYCGASPLTGSDTSGTIRWTKLRILLAKLFDDLDNPTKDSLPHFRDTDNWKEKPTMSAPATRQPPTDPNACIELPDGRQIPIDPDKPGGRGGSGGEFTNLGGLLLIPELVEAFDPTPVGTIRDIAHWVADQITPYVEEANSGNWRHGGTSINDIYREFENPD